jgi:hypothetical protein
MECKTPYPTEGIYSLRIEHLWDWAGADGLSAGHFTSLFPYFVHINFEICSWIPQLESSVGTYYQTFR